MPSIYIVAPSIATAYWVVDGTVHGCGIQIDGTPDFANDFVVEGLSLSAETYIETALGLLAQHIEAQIANA